MAKRGRKKKKNLKPLYIILTIVILIIGIYFAKDFLGLNEQFLKLKYKVNEWYFNVKETLVSEEQTKEATTTTTKVVNGNLEMHVIDVGQRR